MELNFKVKNVASEMLAKRQYVIEDHYKAKAS